MKRSLDNGLNNSYINDYQKRLRRLREYSNMTQKEIAERLGVSPTMVSRIELGRIPLTKPMMLAFKYVYERLGGY